MLGIPDHGRLLIIEPVLPETVDGTIPSTIYLSDLNMLVNLGGRERTRADFDTLCQRVGVRGDRRDPTPPARGLQPHRGHPNLTATARAVSVGGAG